MKIPMSDVRVGNIIHTWYGDPENKLYALVLDIVKHEDKYVTKLQPVYPKHFAWTTYSTVITGYSYEHDEDELIHRDAVEIIFKKYMRGFDRLCYYSKDTKRYYAYQDGLWYSCSNDYEPSHVTSHVLVFKKEEDPDVWKTVKEE